MKFYELGRSMIEMLGVLAIIGVLSVGAIAGYSKAMLKYKLNKQAQQYSELFAETVYVLSETNFSSSNNTHIYKILEKMNKVPEGFIENNWYDAMGNYIERWGTTSYYIHHHRDKYIDVSAIDSCVNIFELIKPYASSSVLKSVGLFCTKSSIGKTFSSDKYCNSSSTCLSKLTTKDFRKICTEYYDSWKRGESTGFSQPIHFEAL